MIRVIALAATLGALGAAAAAGPARAARLEWLSEPGLPLLAGPVWDGNAPYAIFKRGERYEVQRARGLHGAFVGGGGAYHGSGFCCFDQARREDLDVSASGGPAVWSDFKIDGSARYSEYWFTGAVSSFDAGSAAQPLVMCDGYGGDFAVGLRSTLDGATLIVATNGCGPAGGALRLRDMATGASRVLALDIAPSGQPLSAAAGLVALAGWMGEPYVAPEVVELRSEATGAVLLRLPGRPARDLGPAPLFAVDPSGSLFSLVGSGCAAHLTVASAAQPSPRTLPGTWCRGPLAAAAGRAIAEAPEADGTRTLRATTLGGAQTTLANLGPAGERLVGRVDAHGTLATYALGKCTKVAIYRASLTTPGPLSSAVHTCPAKLLDHSLTLGARGVSARVLCAHGCMAELVVVLPKGRYGSHRRRIDHVLGRATRTVLTSKPTKVGVVLDAAARRLIRPLRPARLRLELRAERRLGRPYRVSDSGVVRARS